MSIPGPSEDGALYTRVRVSVDYQVTMSLPDRPRMGHYYTQCQSICRLPSYYVHPRTVRGWGTIYPYTQCQSIRGLPSYYLAKQRLERRKCFLKLISNVHFLARQGLAFRGDGNKSDSNFMQLLHLRIRSDWVKQKTDTIARVVWGHAPPRKTLENTTSETKT